MTSRPSGSSPVPRTGSQSSAGGGVPEQVELQPGDARPLTAIVQDPARLGHREPTLAVQQRGCRKNAIPAGQLGVGHLTPAAGKRCWGMTALTREVEHSTASPRVKDKKRGPVGHGQVRKPMRNAALVVRSVPSG